MNQKTKKLLRLCAEAGYKYVAIGVNDPRNKRCRGWPFRYDDSIFCSPDREIDDHPAIWEIVRRCGIRMGCGNGDQAHIGGEIHKLTRGAYKLPLETKHG